MSIKRWHAYIEDDDSDDLFVSHLEDAKGTWVLHDAHVAEVARLREALRAVLVVRDMPKTVENIVRAALEGRET